MRRGIVLAALTAALSAPLAPALADDTVTVPALAFPDGDTYLTYFGCVDLYHADTRSPQVTIVRGSEEDGQVPAGRRALALRMPGAATASGPVRRVDSVAGTTVAGFSARASDPAGAQGVAWVWYAPVGTLPGQVWAGRADLSVGPAWAVVDTASAGYRWTRYDAASGEVLEDGGTHPVAEFTALHGDGPGYLMAGFGCDGTPFGIDALRYGAPGTVTTWDLEGVAVTTTMAAGLRAKTGEVTLTGTTTDAVGTPYGTSLVLEERPLGTEEFQAVETAPPAADGVVRLRVRPEVTTEYRWYLPETGYADAGHSSVVRVEVPQPVR